MLDITITNMREAATKYIMMGHPVVFSTISWDSEGKKTSGITTKWKKTDTEDTCIKTIEQLNDTNVSKFNAIGIRCDNIIAIDFDYQGEVVPIIVENIAEEAGDPDMYNDILSGHCQYTSKGRVHLVFQLHPGLTRKYNLRAYSKYDIDIQTSHTSVLWCAPTKGFQDTRYRWVTRGMDIPKLPDSFVYWVNDMVAEHEKRKARKSKPSTRKQPINPFGIGSNKSYIEKIKDSMEAISEGNRNIGLYKSACNWVEKIKEDELIELMQWANQNKCSPPMGESELSTLINQVLQRR